jgi:hypothetical protein
MKRDKDELITANYAVADLVVPIPHMFIAMAEDDAFTNSKDADRSDKVSEPPANDPLAQASFEALIDLLETSIAPDSWEARSGPGSIMPYRTTLSLVIRQTQAVHEEISKLFGQLRRLQDLQVELQIDVLTIAGTASRFPVELEPKVDGTASHLAEARSRRVRESIAESVGVAIVSSPKMILCNGQGAELKLRRRLGRVGTVPLPPLQLVPAIAADRSAVRLKVAVGATQALDAIARSREFVVKQGESLLVDITGDLDSKSIPGLPGVRPETFRRERQIAPTDRVLLLVTPKVIVQTEE